MASAFYLAKGGCKVTLFEKRERLGGIVDYAIPDFRITQDEIGKDAALLTALGVEVKTGTEVSVADVRNMSLGYALTEDFPMKNGRPLRDYAHLGLFRAPQVPPIEAVLITSPNVLPLACGAKGVGEISSVPTAAACENAYYKFDHKERLILPMKETYYNKTPLEPDSQSQVGLKAKLD